MNINQQSPAAIAQILGDRLKQARLNTNLTQVEVAERTGLSRKTIMNAEKGHVQLEALVAIMSALELSDNLNALLPPQTISPLQLAKLQGKKRQRASGRHHDLKNEETAEW